MGCDLCGADGPLYEVVIEGVDMSVCSSCKGFGRVKRSPTPAGFPKKSRVVKEPEVFEIVVDNFSSRIKEARESKGLKQTDLAKSLGLKESQLHKFETGSSRPDLATARRLEKALGIVLVEKYVENHKGASSSSGTLTIGDLIGK